MKNKKVISLLLTVMMLCSCFSFGAYANSWRLDEILEVNVAENAAYYEPFNTEAAVTDFGTVADGTLKYDSENGRLEIEKPATDPGKSSILTAPLDSAFSTGESKLCYFEFVTAGTPGISVAEYAVRVEKESDSKLVPQVRFFIDWASGKLSAISPTTGRRADIGVTVDKTQAHTVKFLLDYGEDLYYIWIDNGENPVIDGRPFYSGQDEDYTSEFYASSNDTKDAGSLYIDDFKITPMKEKVLIPEVTGNYLYEEDFDDYTEGNIGAIIGEDSEDALNNLANTSGVLDTDATSHAGSFVNDLSIEKGEGSDNKVLKIVEGVDSVHNYYYKNACTPDTDAESNLVIQTQIRIPSGSMYVCLGSGSYTNSSKVYVKITDGNIYVKDNNGAQTGYSSDCVDDKYHTLTYLLNKNEGTNGTFSLWVDDTLLVQNMGCFKSIKEGWPNSIYFNFDKATTAYVDDVRVFEPSESFLNILKLSGAIEELADICTAVADEAPVDFKTADAIKTAAGLSDNTSTTISIADSKEYYNGSNIIFPLYADTTDVAVRITDGDISFRKSFAGVSMPAAYSIQAPSVNSSLVAGEVNNAGTISATVRNAASDNGRLMIVAALYNTDTGEMLAVQTQKNTLGDASAFNCELDLTNTSQLPENTTVKLFVLDGAILNPLV